MSAALLAILGVALAGLLGIVQFQMSQFGHRLDRHEDRFDRLEKSIADLRYDMGETRGDIGKLGERLDVHLTDHPGQGQRLLQGRA